MIELIIKEHLKKILDVHVYFEFPKEPPAKMLVINVEIEPRENFLDSAIVVVDSYGPSLLEAASLNDSVRKALDGLVSLPNVSSSKRGASYPLVDTANKRYRYQAVQNITYYEE
jgi:hypothetical protein